MKAYLSNHVGHPDFEAIALAIRACATVKDLKSADQVFQRYLQLVGVRNTSDDNENVLHTEAELTVWHEMLGAAFNAGDSHKAISVFEQLASQKPSSGLKVDPRILERMLSGFSELGDGTSAIAWAQRVTTDPHFSTQIGLTPSFLTPSITLLASRISSFDFSAASDACFIYSVMRDFANTTNQPYSGAALQQLITTIIPHTFQAPRTNTVTQLWDRLAEFVQQFHEDAAKHASANLYLAPESVALLERARSSPAVQTPSEEIHPDTQSQGPRESLTSGPSEHASQNSTPSPYSVTSTDFTPPVDDIQKTSDSTLPIVRPLSPAASYVASSNYAPAQSLSQWDQEATSEVEQIFREVRHYDSGGPQAARIIIRAAQKHGFVHPELVSEALARCGRARDDSLVEQAYLAGYASLHLLELDPAAQLEGWYQLENAALIAAANAGHLDRASTHRSRLIEAGSAPSAEAYGTLILNAKDTTDDASVAIELFEESRRLGVAPNTFLFNNLISRLSKARRTKAVLECFEQMKAAGIATTSVTYGAVINAVGTCSLSNLLFSRQSPTLQCCKIGDVSAAAFLFEEMTSLVDFTPKVPPYNTSKPLIAKHSSIHLIA